MSNCPKSWSISRTCPLTAHTPRPRASSSGNRSGAAGEDATASADSHAPKNISCSRLSCSLLGRHLPQVRHTSIAPMWSNRWICVRSQSETCAGPASRNADCSAAAHDWSARMSHAPERWTTRAPSPATVTWTSGSRTCIDDSPSRQTSSNAAGTQRHDPAAFAYNRSRAPVAQWIEQPPPKGQVGRSIRLWGARLSHREARHSLRDRQGRTHATADRTWFSSLGLPDRNQIPTLLGGIPLVQIPPRQHESDRSQSLGGRDKDDRYV